MDPPAQLRTGAGTVASLHLHPAEPGQAMVRVLSAELVAGAGVAGDRRYFNRRNRTTGAPGRRQISLIEREQISEHAATLGLERIPPGSVRANIESTGIDLAALVGRQVRVGTARLEILEFREPCAKMDAICPGLRDLMHPNRQGVIARVVESGWVSEGDAIKKCET